MDLLVAVGKVMTGFTFSQDRWTEIVKIIGVDPLTEEGFGLTIPKGTAIRIAMPSF